VNFVDYRNQLLQRREGEIALWQLVRNFSQWFFDLLRNFVLVGLVQVEQHLAAGLLVEFAPG